MENRCDFLTDFLSAAMAAFSNLKCWQHLLFDGQFFSVFDVEYMASFIYCMIMNEGWDDSPYLKIFYLLF